MQNMFGYKSLDRLDYVFMYYLYLYMTFSVDAYMHVNTLVSVVAMISTNSYCAGSKKL